MTRDHDVRLAHSRDASGLVMIPESVARAECTDDVVQVVREAAGYENTVTPAGSQTSMTAASITDQGVLLSLAPMKKLIDVDIRRQIAIVEPGITIEALNRELATSHLMFAPDPTSEHDATIGGAIACNASGARSLYYGATRRHVDAVKVVHADASVADYRRSHPEKNTVGYSAVQDPVDWFVGSEGTLGIVVQAELSLVPLPQHIVGLAVPFTDENSALSFVVAARRGQSGRNARCLEFLDQEALAIASKAIGANWTATASALVYLEDDAGESHDTDSVLSAWLGLAETSSAVTDEIRVFEGTQPLREARAMRHSVPATMNERGSQRIANGGRKVSTDWAVPYELLGTALEASRAAVARHNSPEPVTYGHAGNGHPHQNFIAEDSEMLKRIERAIEDTLASVMSLGGTVSAEHGLGKLKRKWLGLQLGARQIDVMRAIKYSLDPAGMFAPGNVL